MVVSVLIPITHRGYAKGNKAVSVNAATLAGVIARLVSLFPELEGRVLDRKGDLLPGMEICVNGIPVFPFNSELNVADGDEIRISSIITGG
jgi:molybdopterin converting factor small subunit